MEGVTEYNVSDANSGLVGLQNSAGCFSACQAMYYRILWNIRKGGQKNGIFR